MDGLTRADSEWNFHIHFRILFATESLFKRADWHPEKNGPAPGYDAVPSRASDVLTARLKPAEHECNVVIVSLRYISEVVRFEERY